MKISVLIIAHNEEKYIRQCLESVTHQTHSPDEIILIAHNCTDNTEIIAKEFSSVRTVPLHSPAGSWHARAKGFEEVAGDIVVCTDGDSYVENNWVEEMIKPLLENNDTSGVGSPVIFTGHWWSKWNSINFFYLGKWFDAKPKHRPFYYFWGASFAIRKRDYEKVGGFSNLPKIQKELGLINPADDWYLALLLLQMGKIKITYKTRAYAHVKERNIFQYIQRLVSQKNDGKKLSEYYKKFS